MTAQELTMAVLQYSPRWPPNLPIRPKLARNPSPLYHDTVIGYNIETRF